jgi:hypothetical protein
MAYDDGLRSTLLGLERDFDVHVTVVNASGPGGGWPEVSIAGMRSNVERCLRTRWVSGDDEQDDEFVREVMASNRA